MAKNVIGSKPLYKPEQSGFTYGRNEVSPDSEQIELTMPKGITAKLCERGANSRRIYMSKNMKFSCYSESIHSQVETISEFHTDNDKILPVARS